MKYGERLKYVRELRGLKQNQLSEFAGVAQGLISQLENSDTAGGSKYTAQIAAAMNISPTWLQPAPGQWNLLSTKRPTLRSLMP